MSMSASPLKADIPLRRGDVGFVPIASQQIASRFDHLVGAGEQRW
jgi:hypothetical protein